MTKDEATQAVQMGMREHGLTFAELADQLRRPKVWVAAAVLGQHPFSPDDAALIISTLRLPLDVGVALQQIPTRGGLGSAVPVDPTIYRFYELIQVYGPAFKALIDEEFGDGIMSTINFRADIKRVADPAGDRVRITLDGKFLPYQFDDI
jgi:cyanate lyase